MPKSMPEMIPVKESSNIHSFGYDPSGRLLYVIFKTPDGKDDGPLYRYIKVPKGVFNRFSRSASKGLFMWTHIRSKFGYEKWSGSAWRKEAALVRESALKKKRKRLEAERRR